MCQETSTGTNKMRITNALYLKGQRLIAETHGDTQIKRYTHGDTQKHTHKDTNKRLLQRITLPFASHINLNIMLLQEHSNIVPTQFI